MEPLPVPRLPVLGGPVVTPWQLQTSKRSQLHCAICRRLRVGHKNTCPNPKHKMGLGLLRIRQCTLKNVQSTILRFCAEHELSSMTWSDNGGQFTGGITKALYNAMLDATAENGMLTIRGKPSKIILTWIHSSLVSSLCEKISLRNHPTYRAPAVAPGLAPLALESC